MRQNISAKQKKNAVVGMVFGVFDGLHAGHRFFLRTASRECNKLITVIARDASVQNLKHRKPLNTQRKRSYAVSQLLFVWRAVLGDRRQGTYAVIRRYTPNLICLGYDQKALLRDLKAKMRAGSIPYTKTALLKSFHPRRYHTSFLHVAHTPSKIN